MPARHIFLSMYIKQKVTLSNSLINTIRDYLEGCRCTYFLETTANYIRNFMPPGTVCRYESEQAYMNQFIFTWSYSKHRIRALWIKHLGLKIVNNIGQVPTCEEHFNYKICLADSIIFDRVKAWPNDLDNIIKGRKKRDSNNCKPIILGELIQEMLQLAAGAMCAGRTCYTTLWLNTGPLEADDNNLRYCS